MAKEEEEKTWYFNLDGQNHGPLSFSELKKQFQARSLPPTTMVWRSGMETWAQADEIEAVQSFFDVPLAMDPSQMTIPLETELEASLKQKTAEDHYSATQTIMEPASSQSEPFPYTPTVESPDFAALAEQVTEAISPSEPDHHEVPTETSEMKREPIGVSSVNTGFTSKNTGSLSIPAKTSGTRSMLTTQTKSQNTNSPEDMSVLTELRPDEVDDKTGAIDLKSLKAASKEARKARDIGAKAKKKFIATGVQQSYIALALGMVALSGLGYLGYLTRASWMTSAMPALSDWLERVVSPLPTLEEVGPEDYRVLKQAVSRPIKKDGPSISVVVAKTSETRPTLIVGSNLPEGTHLNLYLHSVSGKVLTEKQVDITVPLLVSQMIAKSPPLHAPDGEILPPGEYEIIVVDDTEQVPAVKTVLGGLSNYAGALPPYVMASNTGKKIVSGMKMFLGGPQDNSFQTKIDQLQNQSKERMLTEFKQLQAWSEQMEVSLSALKAAMTRIVKVTNPDMRKHAWAEFEKSWALPTTGNIVDPQLTTLIANSKSISDAIVTLHPQIQKYFTEPRSAGGAEILSQLMGQVDLLEQKVTEFKKQVLIQSPH